MKVCRIGEAANPGPQAAEQEMQTWCCANVTGFCNAEAALSWQADLVGISELRGDPEEAALSGDQAPGGNNKKKKDKTKKQ